MWSIGRAGSYRYGVDIDDCIEQAMRVEEEIRALLPGARVARVDRDTVARKGALDDRLRAFARRELDVLVGTQMIAKGHDFPAVTLVGVVSADVGLGVADFRAAERTFQLLTQVAGRAGRSALTGEVVIQTSQPRHETLRHVVGHDYHAFYRQEIAYREELAYPPFSRIALIEFRGPSDQEAMRHADALILTSVTAADGDQEGLPVTLIEAQAMGLPVISSYHAGIPELVRDGDTVAIEGFTHLISFAAGHEIIRQRKRDLTLAGPIEVELYVSTTGTDADWVVKVIDVYPDDYPDPEVNPTGVKMGGYQQLSWARPRTGLPMAPSRMRRVAMRYSVDECPWLPIWVTTPCFLAQSCSCRHSHTVWASGFWQ